MQTIFASEEQWNRYVLQCIFVRIILGSWDEATGICNCFPPKRVQNVAADLLGVETLTGSVSPPQRSLVSQL
jgi:hypothetical protein